MGLAFGGVRSSGMAYCVWLKRRRKIDNYEDDENIILFVL